MTPYINEHLTSYEWTLKFTISFPSFLILQEPVCIEPKLSNVRIIDRDTIVSSQLVYPTNWKRERATLSFGKRERTIPVPRHDQINLPLSFFHSILFYSCSISLVQGNDRTIRSALGYVKRIRFFFILISILS